MWTAFGAHHGAARLRGPQIGERRGDGCRFEDDPGLDAMPPLRIEPTGDGHFDDAGMVTQHRLDGFGLHVLAARDDDVVEATANRDRPVAADRAEITGGYPAGAHRVVGMCRPQLCDITVGQAHPSGERG